MAPIPDKESDPNKASQDISNEPFPVINLTVDSDSSASDETEHNIANEDGAGYQPLPQSEFEGRKFYLL